MLANIDKTANEEVIFKWIDYVKGLIPKTLDFAVDIVVAILIYLIGVRIIALIRKIVRKMMERSNLDEGVKQFLDSILKVGLYFLLIVLVATRLGVTSVAATAAALVGSAGLAAGLAMQGSLANFAGGVLILILKPFEIGDYIITGGGEEGTVSQIQICYTRILTIDNKLVVIPNGKLSDGVITNVTRMDKRRLDMTYSISYDADLRKAKEILEGILEEDVSRIEEEPIMVMVDHFGDSDVVLGARVWVKTEEYWDAKWRIQEKVLLSFKENKVDIPFPQMEVTLNRKE